MITHDGDASRRGAGARHRGRWRRRATLAATLLMVGLGTLPRTLPAQEYYNLDAGRPTRLEDATPTPRHELDLQMPALRLDRVANGPKLWRADSKISYGVAALTEIELRVPLMLVDPPTAAEPRTIGLGGLAIGAARALTIETGAVPGIALTGEWVAPVGGLSAHVGSYSAKLLATKTFAHSRFNLNVGAGTWSVRPASLRASTSCLAALPGADPATDCTGPPLPPVIGCARAPSDQTRFACISGAPATFGEASRARSAADSSNVGVLSGPRYMAAFGVDHAFALSSTLLIADVVVERYVDLYDAADVTGEIGLRHQLSPQVVADIGVSRSFAGQVRSSSVTLGLSFDLPMQLRGSSR
jgi:hypothetical protein